MKIIANLDNDIITNCETLVNSFVRYMPNKCMEDQVNMKEKSKTLIFKRKWYQVWTKS